MYKFIIYSRKSRNAQDGHTQHTHATAEWEINNYLQSLDAQNITYEIVESYAEDFSGGGYYTRRPIFSKIVDMCKKDRSLTLLASKADRIARDSWTGSELLKTINLVIASNPTADITMKQIMFVMAENEYNSTSARFKAMYQAKKKRCEEAGENLIWGGNSPKYQEKLKAGKINHVSRKTSSKAKHSWEEKRPQIEGVINMMKANKIKLTFQNIADNLQVSNVPNASGGLSWSSTQAQRALSSLNIQR